MNYLQIKLFNIKNFPHIEKMVNFYHKQIKNNPNTEGFIYLNTKEVQNLLKIIRQRTGDTIVDKGTYAFGKAGNGRYICRMTDVSEKKLWRIFHNFAPAIEKITIATYKKEKMSPQYFGGPETKKIYTKTKEWVR